MGGFFWDFWSIAVDRDGGVGLLERDSGLGEGVMKTGCCNVVFVKTVGL